jgi:hypothetical protein
MPRKAKDVPGTERYRDERRKGGGPRVRSGQWHELPEPRDLEPLADPTSIEAAITEGDSAGDRAGMGRRRPERRGGRTPSQGQVRRKRTTPVATGPKQKPGAAKTISKSGHRAAGRA